MLARSGSNKRGGLHLFIDFPGEQLESHRECFRRGGGGCDTGAVIRIHLLRAGA